MYKEEDVLDEGIPVCGVEHGAQIWECVGAVDSGGRCLLGSSNRFRVGLPGSKGKVALSVVVPEQAGQWTGHLVGFTFRPTFL